MSTPNAILTNLSIFQSETPSLQFTITDLAGALVDLTGGSVTVSLRSGGATGTQLWSHAATLANQTTSKGVCTLALSTSDSATVGRQYYEARMTLSGVTLTVAYGALTILPTGI